MPLVENRWTNDGMPAILYKAIISRSEDKGNGNQNNSLSVMRR